jgi:Kef-type K+ transport system membrane component KefB/predicted amino acid-binding ACT domain protein
VIATSIGPVDLGRLLLDLAIILAAGKIGGDVAERLGVPAVVGQVVLGVVIGPSILDVVSASGLGSGSLAMIGTIGVVVLSMQAGMEIDISAIGRVGRSPALVAVAGVVLSFAGAAVATVVFDHSGAAAVVVGAALAGTSVGVAARVFGALRALATAEARVVLGAGLLDGALALVILTVVVSAVDGGDTDVGTALGAAGLTLGFVVVAGAVGVMVVPRALGLVQGRASSATATTVTALVIAIGFAALADAVDLVFILGAVVAGVAIGRSDQKERVAGDLGVIGNIFIPVFFVLVGVDADVAELGKGSVIGLAATLSVVAIVAKLAAGSMAGGTSLDKVLIGIGMIPRGEIGLIFASLALGSGVVGPDLYIALLVAVLVSTIVAPPLLRLRLGTNTAHGRGGAPATTSEPEGGWLSVGHGIIQLHGFPPVSETVPMAFQAAARTGHARPSPELLDWFAAHRDEPLNWTREDTASLLRLLRSNDPSGWRLLEVSGLLDRALPEIAETMRRRRADTSDLDPLGALRFPVAERLDDLAVETGYPSDDLVLGALAADVCRDNADPHQSSVALLGRLVPGTDALRITTIVDDARLLRASSNNPSGFDEREVLQLATHLATPQQAHDAYQLALALGPLPGWQREAIDQRYALIHEALAHPELTGGEATNLAAARRLAAQRLLDEIPAIERMRFAPTSYVLSHSPEELARQARLVEPLPRTGIVRVAVSAEPEPGRWKIDVACRDSHALLAHLTEVLTKRGLDIVDATIATWPDGGVLDVFVVASETEPPTRELSDAFEVSLRKPLQAPVAVGLMAEFDNEALPWHTACDVIGPDQPGALLAVSAAFARAKVVVHTARIATSDGTIHDRFTISDKVGRKLGPPAMERVQRALAGERVGRRLSSSR